MCCDGVDGETKGSRSQLTSNGAGGGSDGGREDEKNSSSSGSEGAQGRRWRAVGEAKGGCFVWEVDAHGREEVMINFSSLAGWPLTGYWLLLVLLLLALAPSSGRAFAGWNARTLYQLAVRGTGSRYWYLCHQPIMHEAKVKGTQTRDLASGASGKTTAGRQLAAYPPATFPSTPAVPGTQCTNRNMPV